MVAGGKEEKEKKEKKEVPVPSAQEPKTKGKLLRRSPAAIDIKSRFSSKDGYPECLVGFQRYCLFGAAPKEPNY